MTLSAVLRSACLTALGLVISTDVQAQPLQANATRPVATALASTSSPNSQDRVQVTPFGRLNLDAGFTDFSETEGISDGFGSEIRRARVGVKGDLPGGFGYKVEVDFAGGGASEVTDAIVTYKHDGLTLTAGQHNPFQSLEEVTSSRFSSFIERAAFTDAFGFERRAGVSSKYSKGAFQLQAGLFSDNGGDLPGQTWSADGRAVLSPTLDEIQLHLGGSAHFMGSEAGDSLRYRQRPLVHFTSTRPVNTGYIQAESEIGAGLEAGAIAGPFHAVGEAFWQTANRPGTLDDAQFFGGYAEVGFFLTRGDRRGYKAGRYDRTKPESPVGAGGIGAVQVNVRYDHLDLNDGPIVGGIQNGYFASLVWVPTDNTRLTINYGRENYDDSVLTQSSGARSFGAHVFGIRGQIDF